MSPFTQSSQRAIPFQPNPFTNQSAGSPWTDSSEDVPVINQEATWLVVRALRQVQLGTVPVSVVISGEPGSGKTHLLSRLKRSLESEQGGEKPWYVYVRCNASGATLWRHLRRSLATDLLQSTSAGVGRLAESVRSEPTRLTQIRHLGVQRALENLAGGEHPLAAAAWLRGEALVEADLAALGIGVEKDDEERSRETEAKLAVEALLRFLSPTPVVVCFDQIEALETYPGEVGGYHTMAQMISALVNGEHPKLLLISCIVAAFEYQIDKLTNSADRDRWLQDKATLKRIEWGPAQELIRARLDSAIALRPLRARHADDSLWPLNEAPLRDLFRETGRCLPRTLIQACRREFANLMSDPGLQPQISRSDFLQQQYLKLLAQARADWRKAGGDKVLEDCLPWLLSNSGMKVLGRQSGSGSYVNLTCKSDAGETALMFCYSSGNSFTNSLKKANQQWNGTAQLKILSDPSVEPKAGSKGAQYLAQLKQRGAVQIHPLPEAVAALQAIRNLAASARAGDVSLEGESISDGEVTQWALANLPPELERLRDDLAAKAAPRAAAALDDSPQADSSLSRLLNLLSRNKLMDAEAAALELKLSKEEVASCARRHPMHLGILEGPPMVLFEAVEGSQKESSDA